MPIDPISCTDEKNYSSFWIHHIPPEITYRNRQKSPLKCVVTYCNTSRNVGKYVKVFVLYPFFSDISTTLYHGHQSHRLAKTPVLIARRPYKPPEITQVQYRLLQTVPRTPHCWPSPLRSGGKLGTIYGKEYDECRFVYITLLLSYSQKIHKQESDIPK